MFCLSIFPPKKYTKWWVIQSSSGLPERLKEQKFMWFNENMCVCTCVSDNEWYIIDISEGTHALIFYICKYFVYKNNNSNNNKKKKVININCVCAYICIKINVLLLLMGDYLIINNSNLLCLVMCVNILTKFSILYEIFLIKFHTEKVRV